MLHQIFLVSCDCCGLGCGEVKCPISVTNGDFQEYSLKASSFLENVNGVLKLKKSHNYYYHVQQQLFTFFDRKYGEFVFAIDSDGNSHVLCDRVNPDPGHSLQCYEKGGFFFHWSFSSLDQQLNNFRKH